MKWMVPDFYPAFSCTAEKCRHSCCIGWEVLIDPDSYRRYQQSPYAEELLSGIELTEDGPAFRMDEQGRCAFLASNGLCRMMLTLGEDSLCQICADHPRFRSHFSTRTEVGLGLCCEEACRLLLTHREPLRLIVLQDDGRAERRLPEEEAFFHRRSRLLRIIQNRRLPVHQRLNRVLVVGGAALPRLTPKEWAKRLRGLERLDPSWDNALNLLALSPTGSANALKGAEWETAFEQLALAFGYRHLAGSLTDGRFEERLAFAVQSVMLLRQICLGYLSVHQDIRLEKLMEFSRQYSAEIEYSDVNLNAMLSWMVKEDADGLLRSKKRQMLRQPCR